MTFLFVDTPTRELVVAWSHPWRKLTLREKKNVHVKVTQCMIGVVINKELHKFQFGGLYQVKWPIYSEHKGPDFRAFSKTTLPFEKLSKDRGRKLSLRDAIKNLSDKEREKPFLTKEDAVLIWEAYFERWPLPSGPAPSTPVPAPTVVSGRTEEEVIEADIIRPRILLPAQTATALESHRSPEGHQVVNKVVNFPPRMGFFPAYSHKIH